MGQRDPSPPNHYIRDIARLLDESLALTLPDSVLTVAVRNASARGLEPREAAIQICHDHSRRLCRHLIEQGDVATDLVEFAIASRIDECAGLAEEMDQDLLDLLPDLPYFVRQPCFSDEFREMVAHIATWHGVPEHRWSVSDVQAGLGRRATA